jgi:hypothetical protein
MVIPGIEQSGACIPSVAAHRSQVIANPNPVSAKRRRGFGLGFASTHPLFFLVVVLVTYGNFRRSGVKTKNLNLKISTPILYSRI